MRQIGRVIAVSEDKKTATVRFCRSQACGKCHACFTFGSTEADIELENSADSKVGDEVVIQLHENSVLKASLIMYGIPLIALIIGVVLGSLKSDLYAFIGGILFAGGSFFILKGLEPKFSRMNSFKPRIIGKNEEK